MQVEKLPYLLVYKSTFYDQKSTQKIALDLYTSHTQRPDQAIQEISITIAWSVLENRVYKTSSNGARVSSAFGTFFVIKKVWKNKTKERVALDCITFATQWLLLIVI